MNVNELRNLPLDRLDLDELVGESAAVKLLREEYAALGMEVPAFVQEATDQIGKEIKDRVRAVRASRLLQLKLRREALKPASERRADVDAQIADLEAQGD